MKEKIKNNFNHTIYASYIGYITQAVVNNFVPLLFLTFQGQYGISLDRLALLVSINFGVQLTVDFLAARYVDRLGHRNCIVAAHVFSAAGLLGLAFLPELFPNPYMGIVLSMAVYAIGGGLIEVLVSPIVEGCPTGGAKEAAMSLLHSFYCWGHVFVVLASTLFFTVFGIENWKILSCLWALIPLANGFYYALVPIQMPVEEGQGMSMKELLKNGTFWLMFWLMICSGASEQGMSQWASTFAESGLKVSKTIGDLAGPCTFAVLMGCSRALYAKVADKIDLEKFMAGSAVLCMLTYLTASLSKSPVLGLWGCAFCGLSVGIMWPGTFSTASKALPTGGTAMFAFLALAGDVGCASGPALVGAVAQILGENLKKGILSGIIFPVGFLLGLMLLHKEMKKKA